MVVIDIEYYRALFGGPKESEGVKVVLYANFKDATGGISEVIIERASDVEELLRNLSKEFGQEMEKLLFDELGDIREKIAIDVDNIPVKLLDGYKTKLRPGCRVDIYPSIR